MLLLQVELFLPLAGVGVNQVPEGYVIVSARKAVKYVQEPIHAEHAKVFFCGEFEECPVHLLAILDSE